MSRRTWSFARMGTKRHKWLSLQTMPGMPALSTSAPSVSRSADLRAAALARLCLRPRLASPLISAITWQIPVRHARAGVGPGIASHHDLGPAGGGHHDPSDDPAFMEAFARMVDDDYRKGHFPDVWEPRKQQKTCLLSPDRSKLSPSPQQHKPRRTFTRSAAFSRRSRCSASALPSTAITAPKRAKPSRVSRCTPELSR